jgi:hypothetical protein
MTSQVRRIAGCHLLLRGNRWMPISVNKTLGAKDRCSPGGAVISAYLSAVVEGDTIVGWLRNSAFSVQEVLPDGTLAPLDLTPARLALQAYDADMEASKAGIVGVSLLIAGRRIQEQNTGNLPSKLREAAFERATVQILDKIQGHPVVGVRLYDCWNAKIYGDGQSMSALPVPGISDVNLFRYCQGVIDLDAEIPDRAFDLGMPE